MSAVAPLTIGTVVTIALGSSVLAAGMTQGLTWWREKRTSDREVAYLALRLASTFEDYADAVADFSTDVITHKPENGARNFTMPKLGEFPGAQERWRDLDVRIAAEVLGFETECRVDQVSIDYVAEFFRDEREGKAAEQAHSIAILSATRALEIGGRLRERHGVPPFLTNVALVEYLQGQYDDLPEELKVVGPTQIGKMSRLFRRKRGGE